MHTHRVSASTRLLDYCFLSARNICRQIFQVPSVSLLTNGLCACSVSRRACLYLAVADCESSEFGEPYIIAKTSPNCAQWLRTLRFPRNAPYSFLKMIIRNIYFSGQMGFVPNEEQFLRVYASTLELSAKRWTVKTEVALLHPSRKTPQMMVNCRKRTKGRLSSPSPFDLTTSLLRARTRSRPPDPGSMEPEPLGNLLGP